MTPKVPRILSSKATTSTADFICAPATAAGARSAIAVIRGSGRALPNRSVFDSLADIFQTSTGKRATELSARTAHYGNIVDGNEFIDDVLFFRFNGPRSFTGEDSFEIHCQRNPLRSKARLRLAHTCACDITNSSQKCASVRGEVRRWKVVWPAAYEPSA